MGTLIAVIVGAAIALAAEAIRSWRREHRDELLAVRLLSNDLMALSTVISPEAGTADEATIRIHAEALLNTWSDHRAGLVGQPSHVWEPVEAAIQASTQMTIHPTDGLSAEQSFRTILNAAAALQTVKLGPDVRNALTRREAARVSASADRAIAEMNKIAQDAKASVKAIVQEAGTNTSANEDTGLQAERPVTREPAPEEESREPSPSKPSD